MGRYIIRRILQAIPLLFLVTIFMFTLIHLIPGGADQVIFNPHLSAAGRAALRARFGLDQPVPIQYLKWLGNALTGNFSFSFGTNQPVGDILKQRFPATLQLFVPALALALVIAVLLGVISALRHGTATDYTLTTLAYIGICMPIFLLGLFWFPTSGTSNYATNIDPLSAFVDHIQHLILPMLVLAISFVGGWSRYMRSSMIDVVKQDYIRTGRAKGVTTSALMVRHALRNAVIPLITIVALDFGAVAGGATITEGIFAWPGLGLLFFQSLAIRDYPVLMAELLLGAVFVIAFNLIADILYAVMDPRIRYS
jgi:peptide/nickel transport system permease protein